MGAREKLIQRVNTVPADLLFTEMEQFLGYYGYSKSNKGRTSGSRVAFVKPGARPVLLHRPHGRKCLLKVQVKEVLEQIEREGS